MREIKPAWIVAAVLGVAAVLWLVLQTAESVEDLAQAVVSGRALDQVIGRPRFDTQRQGAPKAAAKDRRATADVCRVFRPTSD